jgi:hypothetical protein
MILGLVKSAHYEILPHQQVVAHNLNSWCFEGTVVAGVNGFGLEELFGHPQHAWEMGWFVWV